MQPPLIFDWKRTVDMREKFPQALCLFLPLVSDYFLIQSELPAGFLSKGIQKGYAFLNTAYYKKERVMNEAEEKALLAKLFSYQQTTPHYTG